MKNLKSVLPDDIIELILFEFSPDFMRCFLSTEISNFFRTHIRDIIVPNYEQKYYLDTARLCGMGYVYLACKYFRFPTKRRKSKKYLKFYNNLLSYNDFPKLKRILVNNFLGITKYACCERKVK